ncbi:MAG: TIGR04190 family B12-binding domain/radical SAM domain protein, partial [Syntrophorhabdales bacterium]
FDSPEEHGYKLRFRDVESHRQAMLQPGWKYFLNYETDWMNRDEIVDSTYRGALALNRVKMERGLIARQTYDQVEKRILFSLDVVDKIDAAMKMGVIDRAKRIGELRIDMEKNISTIGEKKELEWPTAMLRMNFFNIIRTLSQR